MAAREELARTDLTRMLHRTPTAPAETLKTLNPEQYRALRAMGTGEKARAAETPAAGIAKRVFSMIGKPSPVGAPVAPSRARDHESSSSDSESSSSERPSPRSAGTRRPANPAAPAAGDYGSGGGGTPGAATHAPVTPSSSMPCGHHPGTHWKPGVSVSSC